MSVDRLKKYIWIVDTIDSYGALTRQRLSELWQISPQGDGRPIPHRTFFHYRRAIEEQLGVTIKVNKAHEYYIDKSESLQDKALRSWVLDSYAMNNLLDDNRAVSSRICLEPVPSARQFLGPVLESIRLQKRLYFTYASFTRSRQEENILFEPWFVKLFRQRWYMVGCRTTDAQVRTYALDRITALRRTGEDYEMPAEPTAEQYFSQIFGITQSHAPATQIKLRTDTRTAKYLRALPLHESQKEYAFTRHSVFAYHMKVTQDLVQHLLSMGPGVEVLSPPSLRVMMKESLVASLKHYE